MGSWIGTEEAMEQWWFVVDYSNLDHLMSAVVTSSSHHQPSGSDYNLNFTMSLATPSAAVAAPAMENNNTTTNNHPHHQFSSVFDGSRLQLYYGHSS
ncbi:hypothetical protein JHK82_027949 [Glycine max]|nr:hypothetical protein JHK82_027949 [Glycine max]KAG5151729.1 hypothetical protein JHK84_028201 [Glycine max]